MEWESIPTCHLAILLHSSSVLLAPQRGALPSQLGPLPPPYLLPLAFDLLSLRWTLLSPIYLLASLMLQVPLRACGPCASGGSSLLCIIQGGRAPQQC